jgi:hypothetical protein
MEWWQNNFNALKGDNWEATPFAERHRQMQDWIEYARKKFSGQ